MNIPIPCDCMVIQQESDGSFKCRQCNGDWYACECSVRHTRTCPDRPTSETNLARDELVLAIEEDLGAWDPYSFDDPIPDDYDDERLTWR